MAALSSQLTTAWLVVPKNEQQFFDCTHPQYSFNESFLIYSLNIKINKNTYNNNKTKIACIVKDQQHSVTTRNADIEIKKKSKREKTKPSNRHTEKNPLKLLL